MKKRKWLVMASYDANETFEVEGTTLEDAMYAALQELGWSMSAKPCDDEEDEE